MRATLTLLVLASLALAYAQHTPRVRHATWDGDEFNCPHNTDLWADEGEALAGKQDYVYCIERGAHKP